MTSATTGVMLLKRRQPDSPATALNKFCSIRTLNGVYTEFGIDPLEVRKLICTTNTIDGFNSHFEM